MEEYLATSTEFLWLSIDAYDADGTAVTSSRVFIDPIVRRTASMALGNTWGSATDVENFSSPAGHVVETNTLLGLEDVTVPYGHFAGCLKIHTSRAGTGASLSRISWYCDGVGEAKRIQSLGGVTLRRDLTAVVP